MARYRLKERVDAVQWTGMNHTEIQVFLRCLSMPAYRRFAFEGDTLVIENKEGLEFTVIPGDFIIMNSDGNVFPMKQFKFYQHYERVD